MGRVGGGGYDEIYREAVELGEGYRELGEGDWGGGGGDLGVSDREGGEESVLVSEGEVGGGGVGGGVTQESGVGGKSFSDVSVGYRQALLQREQVVQGLSQERSLWPSQTPIPYSQENRSQNLRLFDKSQDTAVSRAPTSKTPDRTRSPKKTLKPKREARKNLKIPKTQKFLKLLKKYYCPRNQCLRKSLKIDRKNPVYPLPHRQKSHIYISPPTPPSKPLPKPTLKKITDRKKAFQLRLYQQYSDPKTYNFYLATPKSPTRDEYQLLGKKKKFTEDTVQPCPQIPHKIQIFPNKIQVLSRDDKDVRGVLLGETKIKPIWADSPGYRKVLKVGGTEEGYG
jgi:hypothetical protein